MKLKNGSSWTPDQRMVKEWKERYPTLDIERELAAIERWFFNNPASRKTKKTVLRYCDRWLSRARQLGGSPYSEIKQKAVQIIKPREMSALDEITHNFVDMKHVREYFMRKYGQCFEKGQRLSE